MTTTPRISRPSLRTGALFLATLTTGLTAGVFVDWSNTIMPGLGTVDDRTFVTASRALDDAIRNPLFLGVEFTGALLLTGLATVLHLRPEHRPVLRWVVVALVCYLVAVVTTFAVHEPLNEKVRTAGEFDTGAEFAAMRAQLDESRWAAWNAVRAVATTFAFGCLAWALVLHCRFAPRTAS
ncbi:DUF1772 domain-containing protein [Streptomyces armeniacus]|uniref:DUF1772 domain-containing protein n=1 Tax=Streptomyces armeniacus TaxID=83291 RepID=A0A345XL02_9ACTN|nr:DUF1772 domain-containing protein [Streptomyces armeniacus]AXK32318.1 DUF1772 domain-containing protein [Streptomyces armeniacus]